MSTKIGEICYNKVFRLSNDRGDHVEQNRTITKLNKLGYDPKMLISILAIVLIKLVVGLFFINSVQVENTFKFVSAFSLNQSPWRVYFSSNELSVFPYPALMLYLYKIVHLPIEWFGALPVVIKNALYITPILLADIGSLLILNRMFPKKTLKVIYFYFLSPVVIYASYYLGHLDLIALFFMILSLHFLQNRRYNWMAVGFALGFSVKIPMMFALPLAIIYFYRNIQRDKLKVILQFAGSFLATVLLISLPFMFHKSYLLMVYLNPQQSLLYDLALPMGDYKLYIAYLAVLAIYARFLMYEKVNKDLLHNFLAVIYSVFVLLVPPSENWYVWSFVLCSVLFVSLLDRVKIAYALSALFSLMYLATFVLTPYIEAVHLKNLLFTTFEGVLLFVVYVLYKYGIKSNSVYKKKEHATIIGIGGDSGVGKSTLKNAIMMLLGTQNIVEIESDGDHKWGRGDQSWESITHLNPKANYLYRQAQYLKALKNGSQIERVEYDHDTGVFTAPRKVYANDYILVAGLHPFYLPQTRRLVDIKIYLDTQESLRRHWKIKRDVASRGYSVERIIEQIKRRELDAEKYIYPQKEYADLVVRFFSDEDFVLGDQLSDPELKLLLMLKLDVEIESMVEAIEQMGYEVAHAYDSNMKFQSITLTSPIKSEDLATLAELFVENVDEVVNGYAIQWQSGYHGFIQLTALMLLSHHMKKGDENEL